MMLACLLVARISLAPYMKGKIMAKNMLYFGDNFPVMREFIGDASVDLIYLDPPFNSKRNYSVIHPDNTEQIHAFTDIWTWTQDEENMLNLLMTDYHRSTQETKLGNVMEVLSRLLDKGNMMAYLVHMAASLREMRRVLKPTGSLYLHCDPTASHYLKLVLDAVFGPENFRNEIVWKRGNAHSDASRFGNIHDTILYYTKSSRYTWNKQ